MEGSIGGAYLRWELWVAKSIGLTHSRKGNKKFMCYRTVFALFYSICI